MARRLRIQYSDAIYHVMARGNGRQDIVQDDADRGRLVACLERAVRRSGWSLYAFVFLTNHLHLVLKTPRSNLAKGMQLFLSSYANGWARRHRHCGHLFQGRYRTELVEDETYLWVLTRYVHLNPVRAGLSATPEAWIWSSYPGYFRRRDRLDWVAYDALLAAWAGEFGRTDPEASYRRFVLPWGLYLVYLGVSVPWGQTEFQVNLKLGLTPRSGWLSSGSRSRLPGHS